MGQCSVSLTKTMADVVVESGGHASWASTTGTRLSCLMGIDHDQRYGHPRVCEARLSPSKRPTTSERVLMVSLVVP
jgi:hypothetical protein